MHLTRRHFARAAASAVLTGAFAPLAQAQIKQKRPDPATFESGDLVWPKKPGEHILYKYQSGEGAEADRQRWERDKAAFLARVKRGEVEDGERIAREIENMTFNEFRARYLHGYDPNKVTVYSRGNVVAVGHVGIIELDAQGRPWVIEALPDTGVGRKRYSAWIDARPGELVWLGRLKGASTQDRAKVATEAKKYISRPYDFWNFNLADDRGFYCSKLVWLCVMRSLNVAIDDDPDPHRVFWLSPKQILYCERDDIVSDAGNYATE